MTCVNLFGKPKPEPPKEFDMKFRLGGRYGHRVDDYNLEYLVNSGFQATPNSTLALSVYFYHIYNTHPDAGSHLYPIYVTVGSKFLLWDCAFTVLEISEDGTVKMHVSEVSAS